MRVEKIKKDAVYLRLRDDILETMLAGNQSRNTTQTCYPASHSDMGACIDALMRMYEVKRRPLAADLVDEQFYDQTTLRDGRDAGYRAGQLPGQIAGEMGLPNPRKVGDPDPVGGGLVGDHGSPNVIGDLRTPMERERDEREQANLLKTLADEQAETIAVTSEVEMLKTEADAQHEAIAVEQEIRNAEGETVYSYTPRPAKGRYA